MRTRFCLVTLVGLGLSSLALCHAQEGGNRLAKVDATYAAMSSYTQSASASIQQIVNQTGRNTLGMSSVFRYAKPNRLFLSVSSPQIGQVTAVCDGKELLMYRSKTNQFKKRPAPANLDGIVKELKFLEIGTELDAMDSLRGTALAKRVTSLSNRADEKINGSLCAVVTGQCKLGLITPGKDLPATITYHVDKAKGTLAKVKIVVAGLSAQGVVKKNKNGKPVDEKVRVPIEYVITQIVQESQVNPSLNAASFTYPLPKDAVEVK